MKTKQLSKEWKEVELKEIAQFINGRAFNPSEWENSGKLIIRIQDLTGSITNPNYTTEEFDQKYFVKEIVGVSIKRVYFCWFLYK